MKMFRLIYILVSGLIIDFSRRIYKRYRIAKVKSENPTCQISNSSVLKNVVLEDFVAIFDNVIILDSRIGDYTYVQKHSNIYNARIGKFCSIGPNVTIAPGTHKIDGISTHPSFYQKNAPLPVTFSNDTNYQTSKMVTIGHDVWIGMNSIVLDGVNIGIGAVVGAGALVTKDVLPYEVVGGIPAKHLKYRFSLSKIESLIESKWWEHSHSWFRENEGINI